MKKDGEVILDFSEQCANFANFYEDLAKPLESPNFDNDYLSRVETDLELIREFIENFDELLDPISEEEVKVAINSLNSNKAADEFGISAEHLKYASSSLVPSLTLLLNAIIEFSFIPDQFKSGILYPILKRGKDPSNFENFRGITVSPLLGKVLELVILDRIIVKFPEF